MGQQLLKKFEQAKEFGGLKAQMRLAILTKIPSQKAANEPDSPENLAKFEAAMNEIIKEFRQ